MKEAILFDLDGTLTNTDALHFQTWQDLLRPYDLEIDPVFYNRHFSGRLNKNILLDILPQLSEAEAEAFGDRKEAEFRQRARQTLVPLPGLIELLDWCDRSSVNVAVVTNAPVANAEFMLDVLKLRHRFPVIVIGELVEQGKPHPLPYLVGLQRLSVEASRAIAFEDSPTGLTSALHANLLTIGVTSTHSPKTLLDLGAHGVIQDFTDPMVMEILQEETQVPQTSPSPSLS